MNSQTRWNFGHFLLAFMVLMCAIYLIQNRDIPEITTSSEPDEAEYSGPVSLIPGQLYADAWGNSSYCPRARSSEGNVTVVQIDEPGIKYLVTGNGFDPFRIEFWFEYGDMPDPDRVVVEVTDTTDTQIDNIKDWLYHEWEDHYIFVKTQSGETVYFYLPIRGGQIKTGVLESELSCE